MNALKKQHTLYGLDIVTPDKAGVAKTFTWEELEKVSTTSLQLPVFDAIIHLAGTGARYEKSIGSANLF